MKHLSTTAFLISTALFASFPLLAQNILKAISDADKAIQRLESSEARDYASEELTRIRRSDKSQEQKIKEIQNLIQLVTEAQESSTPVSNLPILDYPAPSGNLASLIFRPPLQWSIQSIEIAYDLDSVTNVLLSAESLYREEDNKSRDDSTGGSTNRNINAGAKTRIDLDASASVQTNPLNWFQAKAGFDWVISGYAGIDYTNTKNTQWNERAQRALSNQYEEKASILRNDRISGRHLTFYILFKNNTDKELRFNPKNFEIPVYAGENQPVATAKADTDLQLFRIPRNGYADLKFRAELNTTSAVNLIGYMRSNEPQIRLDRAQSVIASSDGSIQDAVQESIQVETVPFRCRDLELQIRKNNQGRTTTVADTMRAINAVFEKAPFEFNENGECVSLVGVPLVKNGSNDWNINQIPVIGINGNFTSGVIPAAQLNRPISENGLLIDVVDLFDGDTWDNVSSQLQSYMIQPLRLVSESGNAIAQNRLGLCYQEGKGVSKNTEEAARWYRMAADQGLVVAQSNLGFLYYENEYYAEAVPWLRKAAEQGDSSAQFWLATCYENGYGVSKNIDEAGRWFWMAANQDDIYAQTNLGRLYYQHKEYSEAVFWFRKAAESGNASAQNWLGICYGNGRGVREDNAEAVKWFRMAANQGQINALYNLGDSYFCSLGVSQDYTEAVKWYRKAADLGHDMAQQMLGFCYHEGLGVPQDYNEAIKWWRRSAEQGNATAQGWMGLCYRDGEGVRQDKAEAAKWFRKAAEQGDANAQLNLGNCYYYGKGVKQDYEEAVKWYRKAADQENAVAFACLGSVYFNGSGITKDYQEAERWLLKAAKQNVDDSFYLLGTLYLEKKNYAEAITWLRKAADSGNIIALNFLGICYKDGYNDYDEAMKWFRKAAEQGEMYSQFWMGYCNEYYLRNKTEAARWYRMSANQGHEQAKEALKRLGY